MNHKDIKEKARVKTKKRNYEAPGPKPDAKGTVIYKNDHQITVEFDNSFPAGHDGGGNGKKHHCWNFSPCYKQLSCLKKDPNKCGLQSMELYCCLEPAFNWIKMK